MVRARIGRVRNSGRVGIGSDEQVLIAEPWGAAFRGKCVAKRSKNHWVVTDENGARHDLDGDDPVVFRAEHNEVIEVRLSATKQRRYAGTIHLHPRPRVGDVSFDVVSHVDMEAYLPGVLAGELYAHWHPETFAAQAVAARSYAMAEAAQRKETSHYDLTDGPSTQVYVGDVTLKAAHRATEETRGLVLAWEGDVVPGYYCSCCGGLAATAMDAISASPIHDIPPLQGHDGHDACTSLDLHQWVVERRPRTLARRLELYARDRGDIASLSSVPLPRSIETAAVNRHGRPTRLAIRGRRNRSVVVGADMFMRAANYATGSITAPSSADRVRSSHVGAHRDGANLTLTGFGMGHGVGLCQRGAQVLAGRGEKFETILKWYFPSVLLQQMQDVSI
jgi:stage II sporulation protein D